MQKLLLLIVIPLLFQFNYCHANSAQPGLTGAGGSGTFSLLYPEDSVSFKKIQMVKELVTIKLFDGYAAIKGTYWMYNSTSDTIRIKAGYPINSMFETEKEYYKTSILFDDLYKLKVKINGAGTDLIQEPKSPIDNKYISDNWYVWINKFTPQDTTVIQVYFLVKTRGATIIDGYSQENINGFMYLLESGSTWKQPIIEGRIQIKLADEINLNNIRGINPDSIFRWNSIDKILVTDFKNLSPTPLNNIITSYDVISRRIDFSTVIQNAETYFNDLDKIELSPTDEKLFKKVRLGDPFQSKSLNFISIALIILSILGFAFILTLILVIRHRRKN